jgi:hypothetical protein
MLASDNHVEMSIRTLGAAGNDNRPIRIGLPWSEGRATASIALQSEERIAGVQASAAVTRDTLPALLCVLRTFAPLR